MPFTITPDYEAPMREYAERLAAARPPLPATYRAAAWYLYAANLTGTHPTNQDLANAAGLKGGKRAGNRIRNELARRIPKVDK